LRVRREFDGLADVVRREFDGLADVVRREFDGLADLRRFLSIQFGYKNFYKKIEIIFYICFI
jgi:hypothetical protein